MLEVSSLEGIEDPFSFTPENTFGAGGKARLLAEIAEGDSDPTALGQEQVYRYARSVAERDRPARIVDLGRGAVVHLVTAFNGYPARLIRVGPAYRGEQPAEVDLGKRSAFIEADLEDYGDLARLEEALAADAPTLFILAGVIERVVDPRPVLRFLRRALRRHPSNRLVLSTPDRIRIDGRDAERAPEHPARFREWTLNELGLALQGAGFEVRAIGWIPQGGWAPRDRRNALERTVLAELSCDEASYRAFLARNGLPVQSDHLVLTTEHADASSAGGIGTYHRHADRVLESPRLLVFVGAGGLPEGWRSFVRQRGWLHVAELCGRGNAGLSGIVAVDAQEVLRAVTHLVFLYDGIRLVEYQDYLAIGHRIAQAKRARLLPPTVTVLAYAHGTHFCLDHARGALSDLRDVEVDARERLGLELADCVWFPSEPLERLYVEQQGLRLRKHELRPSPEGTDPEASRRYREALTSLKRGNPPPAAPRGQVSVIVTNLDGEARFFRDLRLGLENSSYRPAEVFFVDDGSDARGLQVIEEAAAGLTSLPCTVIRNVQNLGLAGARNAGLSRVVTPYVCAHDNDDIILNRYLECACRVLDENPEVAALSPWYLPFEDGADWNTYRPRGRAYRPIGADLGFGLRKNVFGGSLGVFRTEALRRIGGWDARSKGLWEDWQLYLRLVALGEEVWVIPREMFVYRQRKDSMLRTYPHFPGQLRLARALRPLPLAHAISLVRAVRTPTREHAGNLSRLERERIRLMKKVARLESEVSRLRRIQGSPLWRASFPLRFLLGRLPASVRRRGRAGLRAIWRFVAPRVVRFAPGGAGGTAGGGTAATRRNAPPCGDPESEGPVTVRTVRHAHPNRPILDFAGAAPHVFVAGMGRSGTTWVADLINHDGRHRVLFEPFFPKRVEEAAGFEYLQYLPPQSDNAALAAAATAILRGSLRNPWVDRENRRVIYFRRLIKDVRCNLMLKWLSGIAPRMRVVLVVRNPLSVVNSWSRLGWGNVPGSGQTDLDVILAQPALRAAFPLIDEVRATIDHDDPFRRLVLEWCILHYVPFRQFHAGELYVVHYEGLLLRFEDEIERLFRFLDCSPAHGVRHYDNQQNGSSTNWLKRDFAGDKRVLISEWKLTFSEEQVKQANEILAAFSLENIYDGDGLPLEQVWPGTASGPPPVGTS